MNVDALDGLAAAGIDLLGEHRAQLPEPYLRWVDEAQRTSLRQYAAHQVARTEVFDMVQGVLAGHDLLVTPTLACLPVPNARSAGRRSGRRRSTGCGSTRASAGA